MSPTYGFKWQTVHDRVFGFSNDRSIMANRKYNLLSFSFECFTHNRWLPWQYFAQTPAQCEEHFGAESLLPILADDSVICTTEYSSSILPLEDGEVCLSNPVYDTYFADLFSIDERSSDTIQLQS